MGVRLTSGVFRPPAGVYRVSHIVAKACHRFSTCARDVELGSVGAGGLCVCSVVGVGVGCVC